MNEDNWEPIVATHLKGLHRVPRGGGREARAPERHADRLRLGRRVRGSVAQANYAARRAAPMVAFLLSDKARIVSIAAGIVRFRWKDYADHHHVRTKTSPCYGTARRGVVASFLTARGAVGLHH
jgi:hypothetical protein